MTGSATAEKMRKKKKKKDFAQGFLKNDMDSRNEFVENHLPLVISIARKKADHGGIDFEDLVQEGIIGLITAAEKFDPSRGFRFSTYATWWVRQAIDDAILKHGDTVKKPSNYASHLKRLLKVSKDLKRTLGRDPTSNEVSAEANMDKRMVKQLLSLIPGTVSLDTPISDDDEGSSNYMDVLEDRGAEGPMDYSISGQLRSDLSIAMKNLSDKERRIIEMRFGLNSGETRSLREVGKVFQLSPERIRQIEENAINKLRKNDARKVLREYLN